MLRPNAKGETFRILSLDLIIEHILVIECIQERAPQKSPSEQDHGL